MKPTSTKSPRSDISPRWAHGRPSNEACSTSVTDRCPRTVSASVDQTGAPTGTEMSMPREVPSQASSNSTSASRTSDKPIQPSLASSRWQPCPQLTAPWRTSPARAARSPRSAPPSTFTASPSSALSSATRAARASSANATRAGPASGGPAAIPVSCIAPLAAQRANACPGSPSIASVTSLANDNESDHTTAES